MTLFAPTLQAFFTQRLVTQRGASPNTIAAYRDTFRLLLVFAQERTGTSPAKLALEDLDATLISSFLDALEAERHVSVKTRNSRLSAIHSLFSFAALQHPEHAQLIGRVLSIRPNGRSVRSSPTSRAKRSTRLSPHPINGLAPGDGTWPCSRSGSRPDCGSPSSRDCGEATRLSVPAPACVVSARDARSARRLLGPRPQKCCAGG